jgi:hypothetical protein
MQAKTRDNPDIPGKITGQTITRSRITTAPPQMSAFGAAFRNLTKKKWIHSKINPFRCTFAPHLKRTRWCILFDPFEKGKPKLT